MSLEFTDQAIAGNEALKGFDSADSLGKAYLDLQGKVSGGAIDLLPEEIRKDPSISKYKTLSDVAKGHIEATKMIGTIKRPPETIDGYKLSPVEGLHPSLTKIDPEGQKAYLTELHKLGIAADQADGINKANMAVFDRAIKASDKAKADRLAANEAALKKEWGADYDSKLNKVTSLIGKIGGEDLAKEIAESSKSIPLTLKAWEKITSLLSEDTIKSLGVTNTPEANVEKEYLEFANAIATNDGKHPLMNDKDPKHQEAVTRWQFLQTEHFKTKA